jgi:hypothetical protein
VRAGTWSEREVIVVRMAGEVFPIALDREAETWVATLHPMAAGFGSE